MRIGLTGGSGVLGLRLLDEFSRHADTVDIFAGDVRNAADLRRWVAGHDAVVHAAAVVPVKAVAENLDEAIAVNVGGTANVAKSVAENPDCRLVYLSTSHVYAPKSSPLAEADPTEPSSLYGMTKLQGEQWVRLLVECHLVIRIFSFFDWRQLPPFFIPSLSQRILSAPPNAVLDLFGADSRRDLIDSRWIAQVCVALVRGGHAGTVNCGTGHGRTVLDIAKCLTRVARRSDITWRPADDRPADRIVADVSVLQQRLGDLPPADLERFFADYLEALQEERLVG